MLDPCSHLQDELVTPDLGLKTSSGSSNLKISGILYFLQPLDLHFLDTLRYPDICILSQEQLGYCITGTCIIILLYNVVISNVMISKL